jgi:hypothetical protein
MFNTKGQEAKSTGVNKNIEPGIVYAHVFDGSLKVSANTGKKSLELILETPEIKDFQGWSITKGDDNGPKFKGQSGRVSATVWTDQFNESNINKNEILYKLTVIATELGVRDEIDNVSANSIEDWVSQVINIIKNKDLYWFIKGEEQEYNGKITVKLSLPKYKFVNSDDAKLDKFDKNNIYHYKQIKNQKVSGFEPSTDDFQM